MTSLNRGPNRSLIAIGGLLLALLVFSGCDSNSPSAPERQPAPAPPPTGGNPSTIWLVTVGAAPDRLEVDGATGVTSNVSVQARRATDGSAPPDGSTLTLSTSLGTLASAAGNGASVVVPLTGGLGSAVLSLPGTDPAVVQVQGQFESSVASTFVTLIEEPPPEPPPLFIVEGVVPSTGSADGSRVTVVGQGFNEPVRVFFGGNRANVVSVSETSIVVDTPPTPVANNSVSTVDVRVDINVNDPVDTPNSDTLPQGFTFFGGAVDIPQIFTISPTQGPNEGGTAVTIRGEGFGDEVQVFFGGATRIEARITNLADNRIQVVTPSATGFNSANQNSIVDVQVINLASGLTANLANSFQYGNPDTVGPVAITAVSPNEVTYLGGDNVTIFGRGFDEPVAVSLGSVGASPISVTGTEIIARTVRVEISNCADVSGPVGVTNIETGEGDETLDFIYRAIDPVIQTVSPDSALTNPDSGSTGGATVTINGFNFLGGTEPLRVLFGDVAANIVSATDSAITVNVPGFVDFDTESCDDDGDGTTGTRAIPTRVDLQVINLATDCEDTFSNAFTYVPSPSVCENDAGAPTPPSASFVVSGIVGNEVSFLNTSTGDEPLTFQWFFGDGGSDTTRNPSHTYAGPGTYTVTLQVTNAAGQNTTTQDVTVP